MSRKTKAIDRRTVLKGTAAFGAAMVCSPYVASAQAKAIKIGMPTILSGRVAQLGISSRNAVMMEVEKVNAAGGLGGRQIEMVVRDSKGTAAGSGPRRARAGQHRRLRDPDRRRGLVRRVRGARGRARPRQCCASTPTPKPRRSRPIRRSASRTPSALRARACTTRSSAAAYAAKIAKAKGLQEMDDAARPTTPTAATRPRSSSNTSSTSRRTSRSSARSWPKLFQPDYTESHHQDPAGQAAGALLLPVGRRPDLLHRPGQYLRPVRPDRRSSPSTWPTTRR